MQITKSIKLDEKESNTLLNTLVKKGFKQESPNNIYIAWRAVGMGTTVTYYTSGKLVSQGEVDVTAFLSNVENSFVEHIGCDEVGKGDYFGPLVVCSVFLDKSGYELAVKEGVADSKKISDDKIIKIFNTLSEKIKYNFVASMPIEYNSEVEKYGNIAIYLSKLHAKSVEGLLEKLEQKRYKCIVDQFSPRKDRLMKEFKSLNVELEQFHKGEQDIAVALASVFARAIFLKRMEELGSEYELNFPKGSSDVIEFAKEFVKKYGKDELENVAKVSFKTTNSVLSQF